MLVEVLSDGTAANGRGEKFARYQRLTSLREYELVSQQSHRLEVFSRGDDSNAWQSSAYGEGDVVRLEALGVSLEVASLYLDPTA